MGNFGPTETGFVLKRLADIRESLRERIRSRLGNHIQLHENSVLGRLLDAVAAEISESWEAVAGADNAFNPAEATGRALETIGAINQLPPLPARHSTATVNLEGDPAALVPRRTMISHRVTGEIWMTTEAVELDGSGEGTAPVRAMETGPFTATGDADPELATLTEIEMPVSGLDSVWNPEDALVGRNHETDEEFWIRLQEDRHIMGSRRLLAIESHLRALDGVIDALVIENVLDSTDADGRPMRTFEAVVFGGVLDEIAQTIWDHRPFTILPVWSDPVVAAGKQATGTAVDELEQEKTVAISRPVEVDVYFAIDSDVDLGGALAEFKTLLSSKFQAEQRIGTNVRHFSYVCAVKSIFQELGFDPNEMTLSIGKSPAPTMSDNIEIGTVELARLESANIEVT